MSKVRRCEGAEPLSEPRAANAGSEFEGEGFFTLVVLQQLRGLL